MKEYRIVVRSYPSSQQASEDVLTKTFCSLESVMTNLKNFINVNEYEYNIISNKVITLNYNEGILVGIARSSIEPFGNVWIYSVESS